MVKQEKAWSFKTIEEAVENAVFLAGYQNDVDRFLITRAVYTDGRWLTGTHESNQHTFKLSLAGYGSECDFTIEPGDGGFCLWEFDSKGERYFVDHPMEQHEDWLFRNDSSYFTDTASAHVGDSGDSYEKPN